MACSVFSVFMDLDFFLVHKTNKKLVKKGFVM